MTITVRTDKAVSRGGLDLEAGGRMPLVVVDDRTLQTSFTVSEDDSYRVTLVDNDGLSNPADIDYFIRTVFDRPPEVEITRPAADRDITPLEETVIEASARDDFGLARFDLVYAVVGEPERSVDLLPRGRGGVRPVATSSTAKSSSLSRVISLATTRGRSTPTRATGPERFGVISTFCRYVRLTRSSKVRRQSTSSMDASELGDLAELQQQIIVATWRLDRQSAGARRTDDVDAVADAQEELRWATSRATQQQLARKRRGRPQTRGQSGPEVQALRDAVAAMTDAEISLRAEETSRAVPFEMDALNHLLRAEAEVRRRQVSTQQSGAGGRGQSQAREDLSVLFDQELRRDQETNYETRSPSEESDDDTGDESESKRRLRELAERQQNLSRDEAELAGSEADMADEERRRQLDRLTREQNQLRIELEALARDLEQQERQAGRQSPAGAAEISERMRRATRDLSRGDVSQAAGQGQQAAEQLQDMHRQMEGRSGGGGGAALGGLQLEAQQLGDQQRQLASDTRQSERGLEEDELRTRLAARGDQLARRVDSLEDRMEDLLPQTLGDAREALRDALEELRTADVAGKTREVADRLRRPATPSESSDGERDAEVEAIAADTDTLAEALDQVAERLAAGRAQSARAQRLAEELESGQALRRNLDAIDARLRAAADAGDGPDQDTPAAPQDGDSGGTESQAEAGPPLSSDGSPSPGQGGSQQAQRQRRELARLQQQLMQELAESAQLLEELRRQRPSVEQDLEQWAQQWQSGPAPGTEAAKQDFSAWASLRDDLRVALEAFEASRARAVREEEIGDRPTVGPSERLPDAYRRLVESYYQSLATQSERP